MTSTILDCSSLDTALKSLGDLLVVSGDELRLRLSQIDLGVERRPACRALRCRAEPREYVMFEDTGNQKPIDRGPRFDCDRDVTE